MLHEKKSSKMVVNSLISVNINLWKIYIKGFFPCPWYIIPVSIALDRNILLIGSNHQFWIIKIFKIISIFSLRVKHDYNLAHQIQPPTSRIFKSILCCCFFTRAVMNMIQAPILNFHWFFNQFYVVVFCYRCDEYDWGMITKLSCSSDPKSNFKTMNFELLRIFQSISIFFCSMIDGSN